MNTASEYQTHDELFSHADMITCLVFEQGGSSYLIDDRPDNGRIFRQIDETFYHELESLFEWGFPQHGGIWSIKKINY